MIDGMKFMIMRYNSEVLGKGKFNWTNFIPYAASKLSTTIMEIHLWVWIERESGRRRLQSNKVEKIPITFSAAMAHAIKHPGANVPLTLR